MSGRTHYTGTACRDGRHIRSIYQQAYKQQEWYFINKTFVEELEALSYDVRITYERRSSELVLMLIELIEDPGYILMYEANRPLSR